MSMFNNRPALNKKYGEASDQRNSRGANKGDYFGGANSDAYHIRDQIQQKLLNETDGELTLDDGPQLRQMIEEFFNNLLEEENLLYTRSVRTGLLEWVLSDILSYGPLDPLLDDPEITEVMVNGPDTIYVERHGRIELTEVKFEDESHLIRIIDRIVAPLGRRVDESSPMVDARLPNGFRVNATIPPLSLDGPILTIRKFATTPFTANDLIASGALTQGLSDFIAACVEAKINFVISGGTGTGKTTMLNVVSSFIPSDERIITIEDTAELQLRQLHVIRLEKRPPNIEGSGEITIRQLVINALRMRPDRIIVGEVRGGEALDMLQAMNTGHDGSMTTVHSNSPRDTLRRIETMVLMAGMDLPLKAIREQIAAAIDLVVHVDRLRDGTRRVVKVTEVQGLEGDTVIMQDLYEFVQTGIKNDRVEGEMKATGLRPRFVEKFIANGITLPEDTFSTEV